jgi:hypothetical protein
MTYWTIIINILVLLYKKLLNIKYTSNVIQMLEMLRVNFGENIEAHLYNIKKKKCHT